jgi:hypothetical protein
MHNKNQIRVSLYKIIFIAINEILWSSYFGTRQILDFDIPLMNKIKKLKPDLARMLKKDVTYLENNGGKEVIETYHQLTQCFENMLVAAQKGDAAYFEKLIRIQNAYHLEEIEIYDSKEEFLQKEKEEPNA